MRELMKSNDTITVNGQLYDTRTGLPTNQPQINTAAVSTRKHSEAGSLHARTQKSATLRRTTAKKTTQPATNEPAGPTIIRRPQRRSLDIARHPQIKKVAPTPVSQPTETPDIAPRIHPVVAKANQRLQQKKSTTGTPTKQLSTKEVKNAEIARVLSETPKEKKAKHSQIKTRTSRRSKKLLQGGIIAIAILAILGVTLWINLPAISVKMASVQAGISADFPHYTPDGYALQLPITARENRVAITFNSIQGESSFTLEQSKSSWNSEAVRSMVEQDSKGRFLTTRDRGLTVYTYNGNAAWVNKGMLYKLTGSADFSNDTILRIANSL